MTGNEVARYGQAFKDRAVARLLPPQERDSASGGARGWSQRGDTLQRWRSDALANPARERIWTAAARLEAVITAAAMDEAARSAWCREHGVYPQQLQQWRDSATQALAEPEEARASAAADPTRPPAHPGARARAAAQGPCPGRFLLESVQQEGVRARDLDAQGGELANAEVADIPGDEADNLGVGVVAIR
jgi:transposase-like protein